MLSHTRILLIVSRIDTLLAFWFTCEELSTDIPNPNWLIARAGGNFGAIRRKCNWEDVICTALQGIPYLCSSNDIPNSDCAVWRLRSNSGAITRENPDYVVPKSGSSSGAIRRKTTNAMQWSWPIRGFPIWVPLYVSQILICPSQEPEAIRLVRSGENLTQILLSSACKGFPI